MKPVYHFVCEDETCEKRLVERLEECREAILASAFFTVGALERLRESLTTALEAGAHVTFLLGRFDFVTEPKAVDSLLKLSTKYDGRLQVFFDADYDFHYKLALFRTGDKRVVIIGSSNLTPKGLDTAGEINLEVVGNKGVYNAARAIIRDRLKVALPATDCLDEYRRKYNHAKKYRRLHLRWNRVGKRTWTKKGRKSAPVEPDGDSFAFCWIGFYEKDKTLKANIRRQYQKDKSRGLRFPFQWVHYGPASLQSRFEENKPFVLVDSLGRTFGFAICRRKVIVLDERERERLVIHFGYCPGWRAHFATEAQFEQAYKKVGIRGEPDTVKATTSRKLKQYLKKRQARK